MAAFINLKLLLPFQIFLEKNKVSRLLADTPGGSFGFWPYRQDCVTALKPGILTYEIEGEGEVYVAIDQGVLIKTGLDVLVSVRNAISGVNLSELQQAVAKEFLQLSVQEQNVRSVMKKMESGFIHRLNEFHHE